MTNKDSAKARDILGTVNSKNEIGVLAEDLDQLIADVDDYEDKSDI